MVQTNRYSSADKPSTRSVVTNNFGRLVFYFVSFLLIIQSVQNQEYWVTVFVAIIVERHFENDRVVPSISKTLLPPSIWSDLIAAVLSILLLVDGAAHGKWLQLSYGAVVLLIHLVFIWVLFIKKPKWLVNRVKPYMQH